MYVCACYVTYLPAPQMVVMPLMKSTPGCVGMGNGFHLSWLGVTTAVLKSEVSVSHGKLSG